MSRAAWLETLLWSLAALCFFGASGFELGQANYAPGAHAAPVFRVVSWNVGGASGGEPHGLLRADVEAVAHSLRELEPDLVFLQEVQEAGALDALATSLGPSWTLQKGRGGVALFSTHGPLETLRLPLARSLGVRLTVNGAELACAALHASAFSAHDRNREIGATLDALLEQHGDAFLLAGDLNLDLDLDKRGDLFSNDVQRDVETYNYVATRLTDAARGRGTTAEPDRRLDYVFVSARVLVRDAGPWKGRRVDTMDHDPLVADLELR
ncbi:MAG: endonuclease/exonuclease/phosphatase family protein [Planctomycetes bacterium]|nr:endonuclease/exonuclease/phosphatase family protein [Planctomycetota bacterium]